MYIDKCPVDCVDMNDMYNSINSSVKARNQIFITPVNAASVVLASGNDEFVDALNSSDFVTPDGFWLKVASKILPGPVIHHVPTVPLVYRLFGDSVSTHTRFYLLGSRHEIVQQACRNLEERFDGIGIAGFHDGFFSVDDEIEVVESINNSGGDILLIGISSPKKEQFIKRNQHRLNIPVIIGVGGFIDILAGHTPEGPNWLRNIGMMWAYRFYQEPRRMWKRYTVHNAFFLSLVARQAVSEWSKRIVNGNRNSRS